MVDLTCVNITCRMPLHHVLKWQPFRIDALGLITIIGAEQVDRAVGRLVPNRYAEYLPLLGAYVTASNAFTDAISGFHFYNITPGKMTTSDVAGWFQRWCLAQHFSRSYSSITWSVSDSWTDSEKREYLLRSRFDYIVGLTIGFFVNGFLLTFTTLQGDWWGLANAISMVISIMVRLYVVKKNRDAIDAAVLKKRGPANASEPLAKLLVTFNDGKQINMFALPSLVKDVFIDKPAVDHHSLYSATRYVGWIGFSAHIITIGMSGLATQIITVIVIVLSTVLTVTQVGCDDTVIGSNLRARITRPRKGQSVRRQDALVALQLTDEEEKILLHWNQVPMETNHPWWDEYHRKKTAAAVARSASAAATQSVPLAATTASRLPNNTVDGESLKIPMQTVGTSVSSLSTVGP